MGNIENVEIISARPEDTDFIAWIVAQGMHMDSVPPFLKRLGARDDTLYSWQNTRLLRCDGKLAGGLVSYDGATHEERRRNTWVMPDGRLISSGAVPETTAGNTILTSWPSFLSLVGMGCGDCCLTMPWEWPRQKGSIV